MSSTHMLMARLIYGSGIRLMEYIRLRIQDVDFGQGQLYVRDGKGGKDRTTYLPKMVVDELRQHIERVKIFHTLKNQGYHAAHNIEFLQFTRANDQNVWSADICCLIIRLVDFFHRRDTNSLKK